MPDKNDNSLKEIAQFANCQFSGHEYTFNSTLYGLGIYLIAT